MTRGVIRNFERACQPRDFSGLEYGKITPTDIDGSMDFGGRAFVYLEAKFRDADLPRGQRRHLENNCRSHELARHSAIAIVLTHDVPVDQPILFASCLVAEFYQDGGWHVPTSATTCRTAIDRFLEDHEFRTEVA